MKRQITYVDTSGFKQLRNLRFIDVQIGREHQST